MNNDVFKQVCQDLGSPSILSEMIDAIRDRVEYFLERGCRIADHGLQTFKYQKVSYEQANNVFIKRLYSDVSVSEIEKLNSYLLEQLFYEYSRQNWLVQLHIGAIRNNNTSAFQKFGPDSGYDSIQKSNFSFLVNRFSI